MDQLMVVAIGAVMGGLIAITGYLLTRFVANSDRAQEKASNELRVMDREMAVLKNQFAKLSDDVNKAFGRIRELERGEE